MDFFAAIKLVSDGKAITRSDWNDPSVHVRLTHTSHPLPVLAIFNGTKGGNRYHDWLVSQEDMEMEWEETVVMPETPNLKGVPGGRGGIVPVIPRYKDSPAVVQGGLLKPHSETLIAKPNSSPVPKKN